MVKTKKRRENKEGGVTGIDEDGPGALHDVTLGNEGGDHVVGDMGHVLPGDVTPADLLACFGVGDHHRGAEAGRVGLVVTDILPALLITQERAGRADDEVKPERVRAM